MEPQSDQQLVLKINEMLTASPAVVRECFTVERVRGVPHHQLRFLDTSESGELGRRPTTTVGFVDG